MSILDEAKGKRPEELVFLPRRIAVEARTPPSRIRPELSARIDAVLLRALSIAPGERHESVEALASAVAEALAPGTDTRPIIEMSTLDVQIHASLPPVLPSDLEAGPPSDRAPVTKPAQVQ